MSTARSTASTAVTWGSFVVAAYDQYAADPTQDNPSSIVNLPAGFTLARTNQMTDFLGPIQDRVFYGYVAVGGDPQVAVVALRGTTSPIEWWDDLHWRLVPFTAVFDGGSVAEGFFDIYRTFGSMAPGATTASLPSVSFAVEIAEAIADAVGGLDPDVPTIVCGHSLGGALATLLAADLAANTPITPQAWTFASPRVGDAIFAARYAGLTSVSWRIYNQVDVVPYFPVDTSDAYQSVPTGYAITSLGSARWSLRCAHALNTYLHVLAPDAVPLHPACAPTA